MLAIYPVQPTVSWEVENLSAKGQYTCIGSYKKKSKCKRKELIDSDSKIDDDDDAFIVKSSYYVNVVQMSKTLHKLYM